MNIITRSQWNARDPKNRTTVPMVNRTEVIYHHTTGPATTSVRAFQDDHMDRRGWSDIGYNFLIGPRGEIYEGRGWNVQGAHCTSHNVTGIGVAFIGDYRAGHDKLTDAQREAGAWLYQEACRRACEALKYVGHGDVKGAATECPGDQVSAWIDDRGPEEDQPEHDDASRKIPCPPTVKTGSHGTVVKRVQALCNVAGARPALVVDGEFGPQTYRAVGDVQRQARVTADGIVGVVTWSILVNGAK